MRRPDLDDVLLVLGALLVVGGVALAYVPAGVALAGLLCLAFVIVRRRPNGPAR